MKIVICIDPGQDEIRLQERFQKKRGGREVRYGVLNDTYMLMELSTADYKPGMKAIIGDLKSIFQEQPFTDWKQQEKVWVWVHRSDVDDGEIAGWPNNQPMVHRTQIEPYGEVPMVVASRLFQFLDLWNAVVGGPKVATEEHGQCVINAAEPKQTEPDNAARPQSGAPLPLCQVAEHRAATLLLHDLNGVTALMQLNDIRDRDSVERIKRRLNTLIAHFDELNKAAMVLGMQLEFNEGKRHIDGFINADIANDNIARNAQGILEWLETIRKRFEEKNKRSGGKV